MMNTPIGDGMPKGSTVDSDDRKNETGFVANKEMRLPDRTLVAKVRETYRSVSEETYMERYRQLFP
jgi:hypothetical protein